MKWGKLYMLVDGQVIEEKWTKRNRDWYESKGYVFSNYGEHFNVMAEDLSLGSKKIVKVKCDYGEEIIDVRWKDYLKCSKDGIYACKHHRQQKTSDKFRDTRIHEQYIRALDFCRDNGYELLTPEENLYTCYSDVAYICPKHGLMQTNLLALTQHHGCMLCAYENNGVNARLPIDKVDTLVKQYGGILTNKEEYIGVMERNMVILCPHCERPFTTSIYAYLKHGGQRCPSCTNNETHGEYKVRTFLDIYGIDYYCQFRFPDCKYKNTLPFDFYLPRFNTAIEYDGEFHYQEIRLSSNGTFEDIQNRLNETQLRDKIKTEYCATHNIHLIRIPYWNYNDINYILYKELIN